MPPLRSTGYLDRMTGAAKALGWHPFAGPAAIDSDATRTAWRACTTASAIAAAATWTTRTARTYDDSPATKTGKLKVVTEAHVTKIETHI